MLHRRRVFSLHDAKLTYLSYLLTRSDANLLRCSGLLNVYLPLQLLRSGSDQVAPHTDTPQSQVTIVTTICTESFRMRCVGWITRYAHVSSRGVCTAWQCY